ncbi:ATP-binding protein [Marinigracilibium pacificum]|uniref:ATP-binding protein n=1 Tax=Marinigracilibium pacificum TaxID=2729599 RepID=A0A848J0Z1_9BACT|nr:ATP-binding protein [Marinigracilibium pacificum]NMM49185.1 ATP-binding protein [Marinigracilibium pacificum]
MLETLHKTSNDKLVTKSGGEATNYESLAVNISAFSKVESWVKQVMNARMDEIKDNLPPKGFNDICKAPPIPENSAWSRLTEEFDTSLVELFTISVVFTSQFQPFTLIPLWSNQKLNFWAGGGRDKEKLTIAPTMRTILFLLAGFDGVKRALYLNELIDSRLFKEQVLHLSRGEFETFENGILRISDEYYCSLMTGKKPVISVSADFPATLLTTNKSFSDLVLKDNTKEQLNSLINYVRFSNELYGDEDFAKKVKKGYVAMLYGPPGTGKTLTASVLGKELDTPVYAVDLSRVVSKYIGETEKNLEKIFDRLESKECILFFDEADALFGKRTEVKDAKDRYANQEVAYLLQRIEKFPGLVLLASNFNQNLDIAFRRRILTSIFIAPPGKEERKFLWENSIPNGFEFQENYGSEYLADTYQLTGANISNIIKLSCLDAKSNNSSVLSLDILSKYIKAEQAKERN